MHNLELTSEQLVLVLSALYAVSPSGGGSKQYHLMRELSQRTGIERDLELTVKLLNIAHREVTEYHES